MTEHERIGQLVRDHYEYEWSRGDPWESNARDLERAKFGRQLELLGDRHYRRALELGCGHGRFTALLGGVADTVVALDVAASAVARARAEAAGAGPGAIDVRVANIMEYDPAAEGPWDLIVMMESIYCLGWLYPFFDIAFLASELFAATQPSGRFLLTNTYGQGKDWLLRPWMIETYRDLFRNVGYKLATEEVFCAEEDGLPIRTLISVFEKAPG